MSSKKSRLTGRASRDLPLPSEQDVKGGDGKTAKTLGKIMERYDASANKVINSLRG